MILLTGQGDRVNLVAFNGGAYGVTNSRQIIRNHFRRDFAGGAVFSFMVKALKLNPLFGVGRSELDRRT